MENCWHKPVLCIRFKGHSLFSKPIAIFKSCYKTHIPLRIIANGEDMSEKDFEGIPRNKIPWDPKIDFDKCITCGKCVDFCHTKSFSLEEKNGKKETIVNPNQCIVFCRGCEDICPVGAISHPDEEKTQKLIDKLHQ